MGIQDRDYYREGYNRFLHGWGRQGVTVWLIIITSVVFFVQCLNGYPDRSPLVKYGGYHPWFVQQGEVWRLLTPVFLHGGLFHLLFNMFGLYFVGSRVEELYGSG